MLIDKDAAIAAIRRLEIDGPQMIWSSDAIDAVQGVEKVDDGRWISVKDRLPDVGKIVLAFGKRSATTGMFQGINKRNELWWWKEHTIKYVSHWMPLPEPPKEDDDGLDT